MGDKKKATYWQKHLSSWQQSDQTQTRYCEQHDLKLATFGYWRKRLTTEPVTKKLIPVILNRHSEAMIVISTTKLRLEVPLAALEQVLPMVKRHLHESS